MYFFHLRRNGETILDPDGTVLASHDEAYRAAVLEARELIVRILSSDDSVPFDDGIEIADENGLVVHTVTFEAAMRKRPAGGVP
jgi:hypothetical protein